VVHAGLCGFNLGRFISGGFSSVSCVTIPEREPSWPVYLVIIDDSLPEDKADEIHQLGMIAYVRDELKDERHLSTRSWIRPLSTLPKDLAK
jgi:hypothetical protein